jgi:D-alanine transaminase
MPRFAYVNGRYLRHAEAKVHIEDRGYQFADGVYEVIHVVAGRLIDAGPHFDRFERSLAELAIRPPMSRAALRLVLHELLTLNGIEKGLLYFQATRGVAPRDHKFPQASRTSLVATAKHLKPLLPALLEKGVSVITIPDIRWRRCDIKSLALLPNVLGKQRAVEAGAYEAWQVDNEDRITEGTTTNAWIVTAEGSLVTRPLGAEILPGIVRRALVAILGEMEIGLDQRPFSLAELRQAKEAFLTSSSGFLLPVTRVDGTPVGEGAVGALTRELRRRLDAEVARQSAA